MRTFLWLPSLVLAALCVASMPAAQPADFTPQQRTVYENYHLSIDVQSRSGYIASPTGATGSSYNITAYHQSSWRSKRGRRRVAETAFYEAAGLPEVAAQIRRQTQSDYLSAGVGLGMIGGAAGLAALTEPDFTEAGTPNLPLIGVLFLGIGGFYVAYDNLMDARRNKTSAGTASQAADRYNAILIEEIRRAGPNAGAGGR